MNLTKSKLKKLEQEHLEYNRFLNQRHMPKITFQEYIDQVFGKVKKEPVSSEVYKPKYPVGYQTRKQYNSVLGKGLAVCGKQETKRYSGERQLLGIATLHKSNAVPVFARQDAEDIAKMRRN